MAGTTQKTVMTPYARSCAKTEAKKLSREIPSAYKTNDEIYYELLAELSRRFPNFKPQKVKLNTFCANVIRNHVRTILREYKKHASVPTCSLQEPVRQPSEEYIERIDIVDGQKYQYTIAKQPFSDHEIVEQSLDIKKIFDQLPNDDLKAILGLLMEENPVEVAQRIGLPRSTLYDHIKELRSIILESGLLDHDEFRHILISFSK